MASIENSVHALKTTLWWAVPILIVVIGLIAWGVTGRALRPVETIRAEVTAHQPRRLDQRVSEPACRDEVGRLARTMNEMLDRLQDASDRQRQFVSDASHELRSPVAAMRATGEVALAHPNAADWPIVVRRMLTEDDRMEQIVGDLLELARGEETELPDTPIDLDDVALEEVARARRSGTAIQSGAVSAGRVRGSREQLTRVVRNLLDNATRHATAAVRIGLGTADAPLAGNGTGTIGHVDRDRRWSSWWRTTDRGIPPEDRERVFERFTRLDEGRGPRSGRARTRAGDGAHHRRAPRWDRDDHRLGRSRVARRARRGDAARSDLTPAGRRTAGYQGIATPPLGRRIWPVMNDGGSETRKRIASATSCASPTA